MADLQGSFPPEESTQRFELLEEAPAVVLLGPRQAAKERRATYLALESEADQARLAEKVEAIGLRDLCRLLADQA